MINRFHENLEKFLKPKRALIIFGARRVGKTTLLDNFLAKTKLKYKLESGDNLRFRQIMQSEDFQLMLDYAKGYELIAIDEAQMIPNIGQAIKILIDQVPNLRIIATGSSSFELSKSTGEPLTGRKHTLKLYPFSQIELQKYYNKFELKEILENILIYGSYPEVFLAETKKDKIQLLNELVDSYLLKDILTLDKLKNSNTLIALLKLLAFQVGQLVSLNELATKLQIDVKTVSRYIDLLEKGFVLFKLSGYSGNLRNEITKKHKYYFLDNGIRNAIVSQFNPLDMRNDIGSLWENFLVIERLKKQTYQEFYGNQYFLRTYDQKEIDLIEEIEGKLYGFEFKWNPQPISKKINTFWLNNYSDIPLTIYHKDNYLDFLF